MGKGEGVSVRSGVLGRLKEGRELCIIKVLCTRWKDLGRRSGLEKGNVTNLTLRKPW